MLNFVYDNKTTLIFGKGTQHEAGALLKPFGKKVLLHYGGGQHQGVPAFTTPSRLP